MKKVRSGFDILFIFGEGNIFVLGVLGEDLHITIIT